MEPTKRLVEKDGRRWDGRDVGDEVGLERSIRAGSFHLLALDFSQLRACRCAFFVSSLYYRLLTAQSLQPDSRPRRVTDALAEGSEVLQHLVDVGNQVVSFPQNAVAI